METKLPNTVSAIKSQQGELCTKKKIVSSKGPDYIFLNSFFSDSHAEFFHSVQALQLRIYREN